MLTSDVLDTFCLHKGKIYLKDFHVQRSFEAYQFIFSDVVVEEIQRIYDKLESKLESIATDDQVIRLFLSRTNKNSYHYEIIQKSKMLEPIRLEINDLKQNSAGLGLQNFKWSDRSNWNQLFENKSSEADDIIALNKKGEITETSRCNLFFYDKNLNLVYTPTLDTGCVNGVYRRYVILQKNIDLPGVGKKEVVEKNISVAELTSSLNIYSIYIANSVRGVLKACLITKNPAPKN